MGINTSFFEWWQTEEATVSVIANSAECGEIIPAKHT